MARQIGRLSAVEVRSRREPGMYPDGGGLYLQVTATGAKTWIYRFALAGRRRDMGLGPLHTVSLLEAREAARLARQSVLNGVDPIEARRGVRLDAKAEEAKATTFKECAEAYIAAHKAGWKNEKHAAQWDSTLATYVYPTVGALSVAAVDTGLVLKVLEPIWTTKTETASRVRGRIEVILDWATVRGYRTGENPARWKGHLDQLLPARAKVQKAGHHAALAYDDIGAFMVALRGQGSVSARALEFAILTATRTSEVLGATWSEVDLDKGLWIIPPERMKADREHRVPLSIAALAVLGAMKAIQHNDFIFPGQKHKSGLSNMALLMVLRRMKRDDLTAHGFRSTFRDWCAEQTAYPAEVAEMALAHAVGSKVEAAYRRGDLFDKRVRLMADWAAFCGTSTKKGKVVGIRG